MEFNEMLIYLRKQKGLSQEKMGEKLKVTRQTVSKWELGETTPDMEKLIKISELFEISLDNLIMGVDIDGDKPSENRNTQKLVGIVILILKIVGTTIVISTIILILGIILFSFSSNEARVEEQKSQIMNEGP